MDIFYPLPRKRPLTILSSPRKHADVSENSAEPVGKTKHFLLDFHVIQNDFRLLWRDVLLGKTAVT